MRKCIFVILLLCGWCADAVQAESPFYIKVEGLYAAISGDPDYTFLGGARGDDYDRFVPRVDIGYTLAESWAVEFSYTHFGELETDWRSPVSPPVPGAGIYLHVLTDFGVSEKIYAPALSLRYRLRLPQDWGLSLGPSLTYFINDVDAEPWVDETHEDFKLGADASLYRVLADRWLVSLDYHYLRPPDKEAHLFGASVGIQF